MFRITNIQIMCCKLGWLEETAERAGAKHAEESQEQWRRLRWCFLHQDLLPPESDESAASSARSFQNELLAGAASAWGIAGIHRCHTFYVSHKFRFHCRSNAARKLKTSSPLDDFQHSEPLKEARPVPWWQTTLQTILSLGRRYWVYHQQLYVRMPEKEFTLGDLAEVMFGAKNKQNNFPKRTRDFEVMCRELSRAIVDYVDHSWLREIVHQCESLTAPPSREQQLGSVAGLLMKGLLVDRDLAGMGEKLTKALKAMQSACSGMEPTFLEKAVAEHLDWLGRRVSFEEIEKSSLVRWIERLPKQSAKLDLTPATVLAAIVQREIVNRPEKDSGDIEYLPLDESFAGEAGDSTFDEESFPLDQLDIAVDRQAIRAAMLSTFQDGDSPEENLCHGIVQGLITGKSMEEIQASMVTDLGGSVDSLWRSFAPQTRLRMEDRLTEWTQWLTGTHDRRVIDDSISVEIPRCTRGQLGALKKCIAEEDWTALLDAAGDSADCQKVVVASLTSVLLDDVQVAFQRTYESYKRRAKVPVVQNEKGLVR